MAVKKVPAPVGGWNTRDPISLMEATDAVIMSNLMVDLDGVSVRPGYETYVDLIVGTANYVGALIPWKTQYGVRFIAAAGAVSGNNQIFDITTSTASTVKSGLSGSQWKHGTMNGRLGIVAASDGAQVLSYTPAQGVEINDMVFSGDVPSENFSAIHIYKSRSYFATGDEPAWYYSEVNALGGILTKFPIDRVSLTGGNVIEIKSWTRDGGSGPDDYHVTFLDTGEVLVYQGSDPGDASDWALVGRYTLGKILTATEFGGKIHVVTEEDYNILPDDLLTEGLRQPTKLAGAARAAVKREGGTNWQIAFDVFRGWRIVNVPYSSNREQHVTNLRTGASYRFDYPANVWAKFNGELYFGGPGAVVYKITSGNDNGTAISWAVQQAFTDFGVANDKWVHNYRPLWKVEGTFTFGSALAFDYDVNQWSQSTTITQDGTPWDISPWDSSEWSYGEASKMDWMGGAGYGQNVSILQMGSTSSGAIWHSTDYRIEIAGDVL